MTVSQISGTTKADSVVDIRSLFEHINLTRPSSLITGLLQNLPA